MEPVRFLERVTITGADNSVRPYDLYNLSRQFPFVEWGLLIHAKQTWHMLGVVPGSEMRFPPWPWLDEMARIKAVFGHPLRFSGHICGEWVRDFAEGRDTFRAHDWPLFDRYQLNFHGQTHVWKKREMLGLILTLKRRQVNIQMDSKNDHIFTYLNAQGSDVAPLFDLSHGGGVLPSQWPEGGAELYGSTICGYAGGLSPDNVARQLPEIHKACGGSRVWIDCETHVRSDERFDLDKVRAFLTACEPWVIE